jgi:glycosyltransferase involved in cell wall biosynthesis
MKPTRKTNEMRRVFMRPTAEHAATDTTNSIHQIVLKIAKHLPVFGWELTPNIDDCDLIANHAGQYDKQQGRRGTPIVAHNHGLYPTGDTGEKEPYWFTANNSVIDDLRRADHITACGQWVADIITRNMRADVTVINWAIDADEWYPKPHDLYPQGYVLWNKTRADAVCDPAPVVTLAKAYPHIQFVTTFMQRNTPKPPNVQVIGRVAKDVMAEWVRGANVYLGTTKETFGIGTLEALASGVPILSWRHGATPDIVRHGYTGYLANTGDNADLIAGLAYCLDHRERMSPLCVSEARQERYTWRDVARRIAAVYDKAIRSHEYHAAIVIPTYNYARYLEQAVKSALSQTTNFTYKVVVVDDCSTDETQAVLKRLKKEHHELAFITMTENSGVSEARNAGIRYIDAQYIACLDADDALIGTDWLQKHVDRLDADASLGIAYGGLRIMNEDGVFHGEGLHAWPPRVFSWRDMVAGRDQVPTACVFRKRWWQAVGGYITEYKYAQDANLWLRMLAAGAQPAYVKDAAFAYRLHSQSLTAPIRGRKDDFWWDYGWGANAFPFAAPNMDGMQNVYPVYSQDNPLIRVVKHGGGDLSAFEYDRLIAQTDTRWTVYNADIGMSTEPLILAIDGALAYGDMPPDVISSMVKGMARADQAMLITCASGARLILITTPDYQQMIGVKPMCGCGSTQKQQPTPVAEANMIRIRYDGGGAAPVQVYGIRTGRFYGSRVHGDHFMIDTRDQAAQIEIFVPAPLDNLIAVPPPLPLPKLHDFRAARGVLATEGETPEPSEIAIRRLRGGV